MLLLLNTTRNKTSFNFNVCAISPSWRTHTCYFDDVFQIYFPSSILWGKKLQNRHPIAKNLHWIYILYFQSGRSFHTNTFHFPFKEHTKEKGFHGPTFSSKCNTEEANKVVLFFSSQIPCVESRDAYMTWGDIVAFLKCVIFLQFQIELKSMGDWFGWKEKTQNDMPHQSKSLSGRAPRRKNW